MARPPPGWMSRATTSAASAGRAAGGRGSIAGRSTTTTSRSDWPRSVPPPTAGRVFVYAHSLGGLIALGYAVADPSRPQPDGYVLSAPALELDDPGLEAGLASVLGRLAPGMTIANAFDGELLSRDPDVGARYQARPAQPAHDDDALRPEAIREQAKVRAGLARLSVPTLVLHGEGDRLVPPGASEPWRPFAA